MLQEEENDEVQTLACRIDNVKILSDILSCLCVDMSKAQECQVEATPEGESVSASAFSSNSS